MRDLLKSIGDCIFGILIFLGFVFLALALIKGWVWIGEKVLPWLPIIMGLVLVVDILLVLPLAIFKKTKGFSAIGLMVSSYVYGLTLWFWTLLLTYYLWGTVAVFVGLFMAGVGVVPMAMVATAFNGEWAITGQITLLLLFTYGSRILGFHLAERADELAYESKFESEE